MFVIMSNEKMRLNSPLIWLAVLLALSGGAFAQERTWKPFGPENGAWSILAPGVMKADAEALEAGSTKGSYSYSDFNGFFAVIYRDSPKRLVPWKPNYQSYYKKVRNDIIEAAKGELLTDVEFTNGGAGGREVRVKIPSGTMIGTEGQPKTKYRIERFRMFFHNKRFYLLLAVLPENEIDTPAIDGYFNSFVAK
jgi:hypothetical protein